MTLETNLIDWTAMPRARSTLLLAPLLIMAGCAAGPAYQRPLVAVPARFHNADAIDARPASTPVDLVTWWRGFNDPTMVTLVEEALRNNLDIAQAAARVQQARAGLRAANAALLPSGQGTANATYQSQSLETPIGRALSAAPGFERSTGLYGAGVGASWEPDVFGGLRNGQTAARADYAMSRAEVSGVRISVAAQTAEIYLTIRGLQQRLAIAVEQVETQRRLVAIVDLQFRKGVAAELQLRQAEGAYQQVAATLPGLRIALETAMNALDVLTGQQPGTHHAALASVSPIPVAPKLSDAGGPADLFRRRPDLIAAEQRLIASNARIGSALAEYYPKFSLSGLVGTATTAVGGLFGSAATQGQGILGLRWRLFDFGRVDAEVAAARGRDAEALAAYRLAIVRASEDVENAFAAVAEREGQIRTLQQGETALDRARSASLAAYKGGVVSLIEVLDAENRLLATRDAAAQARVQSAQSAVAAFRALGGGWSPTEDTVASK